MTQKHTKGPPEEVLSLSARNTVNPAALFVSIGEDCVKLYAKNDVHI